MLRQAVPWLASGASLWAYWLLARKRTGGWVLAITANVLYAITAAIFGAWGLLLDAVVTAPVKLHGLLLWRSAEADRRHTVDDADAAADAYANFFQSWP